MHVNVKECQPAPSFSFARWFLSHREENARPRPPTLEPCLIRLFSLIQGGCPFLTGETVPPSLALPSSFSTSAAGPIGIKLLTRSCDGLQPDRSRRSGDLCAFVHAPPCSRIRSLHEGRKFCNLDHAASASLGIFNSNLSEDKTEYEPPAFSPPCSPPGSPSWTSDDAHHLDADRPRDEHPSTLDPTHGLTTPPVAPFDLSCTEQLSEGSSVATQNHAEAEQMTASLHRLRCSPPSLPTPAPPPLPDGQATSPLPAPSLLEAAADISSRDISWPFSLAPSPGLIAPAPPQLAFSPVHPSTAITDYAEQDRHQFSPEPATPLEAFFNERDPVLKLSGEEVQILLQQCRERDPPILTVGELRYGQDNGWLPPHIFARLVDLNLQLPRELDFVHIARGLGASTARMTTAASCAYGI